MMLHVSKHSQHSAVLRHLLYCPRCCTVKRQAQPRGSLAAWWRSLWVPVRETWVLLSQLSYQSPWPQGSWRLFPGSVNSQQRAKRREKFLPSDARSDIRLPEWSMYALSSRWDCRECPVRCMRFVNSFPYLSSQQNCAAAQSSLSICWFMALGAGKGGLLGSYSLPKP